MIQALLRRIGTRGLRSGIGLLLVLAVALVALTGGAHLAGADGAHAPDGCGGDSAPLDAPHDAACAVCDAAIVAAGAAVASSPPCDALGRVESGPCPPRPHGGVSPLTAEPGRIACPRGPPCAAPRRS